MSREAAPQVFDPMSPLKEDEQEKLEKINRLLTQSKHPAVAPRLRLAGYTDAEQRIGQDLYMRACGFERSLDEYVSLSFAKAEADAQNPILTFRVLDNFENTWFPRIEPLLRRYIEPASRDAFIRAFFQDLSQQPLGPDVVGSVEKLVKRLDGLKASPVGGAQEAYQALEARGLTAELLASVRAELGRVREFTADPTPTIDPAIVEASARAQRAAFDDLCLWYNDWAATLRQSLDHNNLLRLGLRDPKPRPPKPSTQPPPPSA